MGSILVIDLVRNALAAVVENGRWQPGIGDPDPLGVFLTACYFLAGALCLGAGISGHLRKPTRGIAELPFWSALAFLTLLLGINKQLDLQMWLKLTGKQLALAQGWYGYRIQVMNAFLLALAASGMAFLMLLGWHVRKALRYHLLAVFGLSVMIGFVLIRAGSLLHVALAQRLEAQGMWIDRTIEFAALACLVTSALRAIYRAWLAPPDLKALPQQRT